MTTSNVIDVKDFSFTYKGKERAVLNNVNLSIGPGERCLLVGVNGTGKSTLLRIISGKKLVFDGHIKVFGKLPTENKGCPRGLVFLTCEWATNPLVKRDVVVKNLINLLGGQRHPKRTERLINLLEIDVEWHMHSISDGQRRRVQLLLGLIEPFKVLLMDEVTIELDVCVRRRLLNFLREETETRNASIVFATHIFDGLGDWATHLCHLYNGTVKLHQRLETIQELNEFREKGNSFGHSPLLQLVETWLGREEKDRRLIYNFKDKSKSHLQQLKENGRVHGDKYYDYWKQ